MSCFKRAVSLPEEERAALAGLLLESLDTEVDPEVEEAWSVEIRRRIDEIDTGKVERSVDFHPEAFGAILRALDDYAERDSGSRREAVRAAERRPYVARIGKQVAHVLRC